MPDNFRLPGFLNGKFFLALSLVSILLLSSCYHYFDCPDEVGLDLEFYRIDNGRKEYLSVYGNRIDTMTYEAYAFNGTKRLPFYDLRTLPIDISVNNMLFVYKHKNRSDTLVIKYDFVREACDGTSSRNYKSIYLKLINPVILKNTFNESNKLINCSLYSVY